MKAFASRESATTSSVGKKNSSVHTPYGVKSREQKNTVHEIIQPKLAIGQANDRYEREADNVADHVVADKPAPKISSISGSLGNSSHSLQSKETEEEKEKAQAKFIQRQPEEEE